MSTTSGCPHFLLDMFHLCLIWLWLSLVFCRSSLQPAYMPFCYCSSSSSHLCFGIAPLSSFPLPFFIPSLFLVNCSVLCHSIPIFVVLFVLELSTFGTQIKDVSCDPGFLDWAVFAEDLIGCVSHCYIEGVRQYIHIHIRV